MANVPPQDGSQFAPPKTIDDAIEQYQAFFAEYLGAMAKDIAPWVIDWEHQCIKTTVAGARAMVGLAFIKEQVLGGSLKRQALIQAALFLRRDAVNIDPSLMDSVLESAAARMEFLSNRSQPVAATQEAQTTKELDEAIDRGLPRIEIEDVVMVEDADGPAEQAQAVDVVDEGDDAGSAPFLRQIERRS